MRFTRSLPSPVLALLLAAAFPAVCHGAEHRVGPGEPYAEVVDAPWEALAPGDTVLIHWRSSPYLAKMVVAGLGTETAPITVRGVPGPGGSLPVIDGNGATTPSGLNFWSEGRGVIKIGGANSPSVVTPTYIVIENLDVRGALPPATYTGDDAATHTYPDNGAAIFVESGQHITIRNCVLHGCGNGLFAAWQTSGLLVEGCYLYDNGVVSSILQHNNYTEANTIVFQYNRFGPLRTGCLGNNLKDRSAGCVIRYNWVEGGNRQLDLVDSSHLNGEAAYGETFVYGNVLIEHDGTDNSQIVHYGGDSGTTADYRKGTLYFFNNTLVSLRAGNTTLLRLSTNDESADCRNNVLYVTASGDRLAMLNAAGVLHLRANWTKPGWVDAHSPLIGTIHDHGSGLTGTAPGFLDEAGADYGLTESSPCRNKGTDEPVSTHPVSRQYLPHQAGKDRQDPSPLDLGALAFPDPQPEPDDTPTGGSCGTTGIEVIAVLLLLTLLQWARRRGA